MPKTYLISLLCIITVIVFMVQKISADDWTYDAEPPIISPISLNSCMTSSEWDAFAQPLSVTATDTPAGVKSITIKLTQNGSTKTFSAENNPLGSANWKVIIPSSQLSLGDYTLVIEGVDNVGNSTSQTYNFSYKLVCPSIQWIQTKVGDVHSNTDINAEGGP